MNESRDRAIEIYMYETVFSKNGLHEFTATELIEKLGKTNTEFKKEEIRTLVVKILSRWKKQGMIREGWERFLVV